MEHKVEEVKLKCGAKGLLIDVPEAPVFVMEVSFRAGYNSVKDPEIREVAHIMEHMACGANAQHTSSAEVSRYIEKNGAYSNAYTGRDYLAYVRECPDFDWERILEQLMVQITTPKFIEEEYKSEFGNVEEEMQMSANDKWTELGLRMNEKFGFAFSQTYPVRLKKMQKVRLKDVKEHYARTHGAKNAVFVIAGNLKGNKVKIKALLEQLGDLGETQKFELSKHPKLVCLDKPVVIPKSDVPNIYLSFETYAKANKIEQHLVNTNLYVLGKILSGGDHSRIYGRVRKLGIVYSLGCYCSGVAESGEYSFETECQVGTNNVDQLIDVVAEEYKALIKGGVTQKEVDEAVTSLKGSLRMGNQTAKKILSWHSGWYTSYEQERVFNFDEVDGWYDNVTPESIQELFIGLIKAKKWGAGFLGNVTEAQAKKWNAKLAEIFED